jgi:beta-aspartyl-dipeptidase (metallo-type)
VLGLLATSRRLDRLVEDVLFGRNVARLLRLRGKGEIAVGYDADLLILGGEGADLHVDGLLARGRWLVRDRAPVVRGPFE